MKRAKKPIPAHEPLAKPYETSLFTYVDLDAQELKVGLVLGGQSRQIHLVPERHQVDVIALLVGDHCIETHTFIVLFAIEDIAAGVIITIFKSESCGGSDGSEIVV